VAVTVVVRVTVLVRVTVPLVEADVPVVLLVLLVLVEVTPVGAVVGSIDAVGDGEPAPASPPNGLRPPVLAADGDRAGDAEAEALC
jgi:hypothetical protein